MNQNIKYYIEMSKAIIEKEMKSSPVRTSRRDTEPRDPSSQIKEIINKPVKTIIDRDVIRLKDFVDSKKKKKIRDIILEENEELREMEKKGKTSVKRKRSSSTSRRPTASQMLGRITATPDEKKNNSNDEVEQYSPFDTSRMTTSWDTVHGNSYAKKLLIQSFVNNFRYPNLYPVSSKGILLYGPPGTGKTLLAKACANELKETCHFFNETASTIGSSYQNLSSKKLKQLFKDASDLAGQRNPHDGKVKSKSILFIDEFDSIAMKRENTKESEDTKLINTLLQELDGFAANANVTIIAATNYPWNIDDAVLSRFSSQVFCDLPSEKAIVEIMKKEFSKYLCLNNIVQGSDFKSLINVIHKYSEKECDCLNLNFLPEDQKCQVDDRSLFYITKKKLSQSSEAIKLIKDWVLHNKPVNTTDVIFGRSGRDIVQIVHRTIQICAGNALKRNTWLEIPQKVKTSYGDKKVLVSVINGKTVDLEDPTVQQRLFNFIICPKDIIQAIEEIPSSLNVDLYLKLKKYSKQI